LPDGACSVQSLDNRLAELECRRLGLEQKKAAGCRFNDLRGCGVPPHFISF
jgi:hypothetical protein